jgi:hypothetical protein
VTVTSATSAAGTVTVAGAEKLTPGESSTVSMARSYVCDVAPLLTTRTFLVLVSAPTTSVPNETLTAPGSSAL